MERLPRRLVVGSDLVVRIPTLEDAADLFDAVDKNRICLRERLTWVDDVKSVDDTRRYVSRGLCQAEDGSAMNYAIEHDGRIVGMLGVYRLDSRSNLTELGYWLAEKMQGSGIMTRCCRAVIDCLFSHCGKNRVELRIAPMNRRSRAVAKRLGFTQEGVLRQAIRLLGVYHDVVIYSVLAREWSKNAVAPDA